ncbi:MAG: hypothetical protein HN368_15595 [Spirochaetales bacterium]|nr:hypothetical protein [Spirochaetales bacterium]
MTHRERFMAVIKGEVPDRLPWTPRLELWYRARTIQDTLPPKYSGKSLTQIREMLNCGHPGRDEAIFRIEYDGAVQIRTEESENRLRKIYSTPKGDVDELFRVDNEAKAKGYSGIDGKAEFIVKGDPKSFEVAKFIIENIRFVPLYDEFNEYQKEIGEAGEAVPWGGWDPFWRLMEEFIGLGEVYLLQNDYPDQVDMLYEVLGEKHNDLQQLLVDCPARVFVHGSHYDSMMTPPPIYKKYILPYLKKAAEQFSKAGKHLAIHADADSKLLLELFMESGVEVLDCYCTAPLVSVTMDETLKRIGDKMVVWGGIPSTVLVPEAVPYEEFSDYLDYFFKTLEHYKGRSRVVVAVGDNVVAEADIDRVEKISELVDKFRY